MALASWPRPVPPLPARAQQPGRTRLICMLMGFAESDPAILDLGSDQHV
jgi:hypothetical protein